MFWSLCYTCSKLWARYPVGHFIQTDKELHWLFVSHLANQEGEKKIFPDVTARLDLSAVGKTVKVRLE